MALSFRFGAAALLLLALAAPSQAKVLAEGKPKGGFYWQKIENSNRKVSYMCRAKEGSKLSPAASCEKAKAPKP
jgi:hypothetical protein